MRISIGLRTRHVDVDLIDEATGTAIYAIDDDLLSGGITTWTIPASIPPDQQYRIRVTARDGGQPSDLSNESFLIANENNAYFVNIAGDTDLLDNEYSTAAGSDLNSGKSSDTPMSSLRALLSVYDLNPGDVIYVDTGIYATASNIIIGQNDAGVTIVGAKQPGHETVFDRGNTAAGSYVFQLDNADGITLDSLTITGGYHGVYAGTSSDSDGVTIRDSRIHTNAGKEILLDTSNDGATITGTMSNSKSEIFESRKLQLRGECS